MDKYDIALKDYYLLMVATDRLYAEISKKNGLTFIQMIILYHLNLKKNISQKELCNDLFLPKQTVNSILWNWKDDGLLNLECIEGNHKKKIIVFTEKGEAYIKKTLLPILKMERKVMNKMGFEQMEALIESNRLYLNLLNEEVNSNE